MATLDLSTAKYSFSMTDPDLVTFGAGDGVGTSTGWSYLTTGGDDVLVAGQGMTFNAAGRPTSGTATAIEIDVGNDDPGSPELVITGISIPASALDDGPGSFWRFLEGDDVILGPELAKGASGGTFTLFGDGIAARNGATGGRDVIHLGDGFVQAAGDVADVGSQQAGAPTADYRGGDDEMLGLFSDRHQIVAGDAFAVYAGSRLTGGNDSIVVRSTYSGSSVAGDAYNVVGTPGPWRGSSAATTPSRPATARPCTATSSPCSRAVPCRAATTGSTAEFPTISSSATCIARHPPTAW